MMNRVMVIIIFFSIMQNCHYKKIDQYQNDINYDTLWNDDICDTLLEANNVRVMKFEGFELQVPNSYKYIEQNSEDSFTGKIGCGKLFITFDYGPYGWGNFPYEGGDRYHFTKSFNNSKTKTIAYSEKIGDSIYVWLKIEDKLDESNTNHVLSDLSSNILMMYARCSNDKEKRLILKIYQTVKVF